MANLRNIHEEKGQSLVEYSMIIVLVALLVVGGLTAFGGSLLNTYQTITAGPVGF